MCRDYCGHTGGICSRMQLEMATMEIRGSRLQGEILDSKNCQVAEKVHILVEGICTDVISKF